MAGSSFRFVHAADFHLEAAITGLSELPDHLRSQLVDAPLRAAERVTETAIAERAEFVLLAGDLVHPEQAGPRAISQLSEQFQRLAERDISVYWAAGKVDAEDNWPARVSFPDNVHVFSHERVEELSYFRGEREIATILGRGGTSHLRQSSTDYQGDSGDAFRIAVAHGEADADSLAHRGIDYWALGGSHQHQVLLSEPCRAEYPGTPQGRSAGDVDAHGCLLGVVDEDRQLRTRLVPCDVVRWRNVVIPAGDATTPDQLRRVMQGRMRDLVAGAGPLPTLVGWTIEADVHQVVHHSGLAEELTGWLRQQFGYGTPAAWTVRVDVQPPASYPEAWHEEDSILGDFLRAVHQRRNSKSDSMDLSAYASPAQAHGELASAMRISSPGARARLLAEAALLGIDLLHGDRTLHDSVDRASRTDKEEVSA